VVSLYVTKQFVAADTVGDGDLEPAPAAKVPRPPVAAVKAKKKLVAEPTIVMDQATQKAIGLKVAPVKLEAVDDLLTAPGVVQPDESQFAYITPRASGVVRSVVAQVGQEVEAGQLLATIDSPEVGQARLDMVMRLQELEIASTQLEWQEAIFNNTNEMIADLKKGESPESIHKRFGERPVGLNRERLLTAYAQFRLADVSLKRHKELQAKDAVSMAVYERVLSEFEVAQATYQGLMDQMGYEVKLARARADQAKRQAETAVRVARERMRVLGAQGLRDEAELTAMGNSSEDSETTSSPLSTLEITAPFRGVILDREQIVPGVAVDPTKQIFMLADLSSVWIEASVHESNYSLLAGSRGGTVELHTPAYPNRVFEGQVFYTGDLVDPQSRGIKLMARAKNADRSLKPGMFVQVDISSKSTRKTPHVPQTAVLTGDDDTFVYIQTGPNRFQRRAVEINPSDDGETEILSGLTAGEKVVVQGGFKLKGEALRMAASE
jgi:RND family efflux transporter MFP subunit